MLRRTYSVITTSILSLATQMAYSQNYMLVEFSDTALAEYDAAVSRLEGIGMHVRHFFPPNYCIIDAQGFLPESLTGIAGIARTISPTDSPSETGDGQIARATAVLMHLSQSDKHAEKPFGTSSWPAGGCVIKPEPTTKEASGFKDIATSPLQMYTAEYMIGRVAVAVILMESSGSGENWTSSAETQAISEVIQGADWLIDQAELHGQYLSFVYSIHTGVPTSYEPITGRSVPYYSVCCPILSWEFEWMDDAFSYLGVADEWDGVYELANRIRHDYASDWSYEVFIVMDENDDDHKFSNDKFAYYAPYYDIDGTRYESPLIVLTYHNDGWGTSGLSTVFAHETGHVFGAPDEYSEADCDCGGSHGYLHGLNGNCDVCNPSAVSCVMRSDAQTPYLCQYTVKHWGWTDTDGDGPADAIDPHFEWALRVQPVALGDIVQITTLTGSLIKTIAVSEITRDPIYGSVFWDGLNNYGYETAPQVRYLLINGQLQGTVGLTHTDLDEATPTFNDISYADQVLTWTLDMSFAHVRCFLYDDSDEGLIARPVWDHQREAPGTYSTTLELEIFRGPAIAQFYGWRPDGAGSDPTEFRICDCQCHADPMCDGIPNVFDVTRVVDVAFRAGLAEEGLCTREWTDVDCSGVTDVTDVVHYVNVAFNNASPETEFCVPTCDQGMAASYGGLLGQWNRLQQ
ncbi:MAG TPA: hypothetical protein VGB22_10815 [candidate division Zixibacteria bacterium]|jgi:hypothetical protein